MRSVDLHRPHVAHAHLQPQALRRLPARPQRQCIEADPSPASALVLGGNGDVEQMHFIHAFHGDEVAQKNVVCHQQLRLVAGAQRVNEVALAPRVRVGTQLNRQHRLELVGTAWLKGFKAGFNGLEDGAHGVSNGTAVAAFSTWRSSVVFATLSRM